MHNKIADFARIVQLLSGAPVEARPVKAPVLSFRYARLLSHVYLPMTSVGRFLVQHPKVSGLFGVACAAAIGLRHAMHLSMLTGCAFASNIVSTLCCRAVPACLKSIQMPSPRALHHGCMCIRFNMILAGF